MSFRTPSAAWDRVTTQGSFLVKEPWSLQLTIKSRRHVCKVLAPGARIGRCLQTCTTEAIFFVRPDNYVPQETLSVFAVDPCARTV